MLIKDLAKQIKRLAKKYKITFICAAQLTPDFDINAPNDIVDAMAGSREISKTAEMILLSYKDNESIFNLMIAKNRNGENGLTTLSRYTLEKTGELTYIDPDEITQASQEVRERMVKIHELGHNIISYIFTNRVSPIHLTSWGGYVLCVPTTTVNDIMVSYGGVLFEHHFIPDRVPTGQGSDMRKVDKIIRGIYSAQTLYTLEDLNSPAEIKKYNKFKLDFLQPIIDAVKRFILDNEEEIKKIWENMCSVSKSVFTAEEVEDYIKITPWNSKALYNINARKFKTVETVDDENLKKN